MHRFAAGLADIAALALFTASPAHADNVIAESTYREYHEAIHAAELCEERVFGEAEQERMSQVIDEKVNYEIGAGRRLTLIEQAKAEIAGEVESDGCDDSAVQEALALYRADLAPALGQ